MLVWKGCSVKADPSPKTLLTWVCVCEIFFPLRYHHLEGIETVQQASGGRWVPGGRNHWRPVDRGAVSRLGRLARECDLLSALSFGTQLFVSDGDIEAWLTVFGTILGTSRNVIYSLKPSCGYSPAPVNCCFPIADSTLFSSCPIHV